METGKRGDIRLTAISGGKDGVNRVVEFLLRFSRDPVKDRARVEALVSKLPAVVASRVMAEQAAKFIAALEKAGAKAVFEPEKAPPAKPPVAKPVSQKPIPSPAPASAKPAPHPKPHPAPEPGDAPAEAPAPKPARKKRGKFFYAAVSVLLIAILGFAAVKAVGPQKVFFMVVGEAVRLGLVDIPGYTGPLIVVSSFRPPKGDLMQEFAKRHAPLYDRRMAEGFAAGIKDYARMFGASGKPAAVEVTYTAEQEGVDDWRITFLIKKEGGEAKVEAPLTTAPGRTAENIPALYKAFAEALGKLEGAVMAPDTIARVDGKAANTASAALEKLETVDIIDALAALGKDAGPDRVDPQAFAEAGHLLSWMAWMKSRLRRTVQRDMLAARALAHHLVASALLPHDDKTLAKGRGLVLLGLGYYSASAAQFPQDAGLDGKLAIATAGWDLPTLREAASGTERKRLVNVLANRIEFELMGCCDVIKRYLEMNETDPDFVTGMEAAVAVGSVETAGMAPVYLEKLMEKSGKAAQWLVPAPEPTPVKPPMPGLDLAMAGRMVKAALEGRAAIDEPMLAGLKRTLESSTGLKEGAGRLLTRDFVVEWLGEEAKEAAYALFSAQMSPYNNMDGARDYSEMISRLWPGSPAAHLAAIELESELQNARALEKAVKKVDMRTADFKLLKEMSMFYGWNTGNDVSRGMAELTWLEAFRRKANPISQDLARLTPELIWHGLRPVGVDYGRRAVEMDPGNVNTYRLVSGYGEMEPQMAEGEKRFGDSPEFLRVMAERMKKKGYLAKAAEYYARADEKSPSKAFTDEISRLLRKQKRYAEAEAALLESMKQDDGSFHFVKLKGELARVYLAEGKAKEAFELTETILNTGEGGAMSFHAEAAEALGKMDVAEKYFAMGAESYPTSQAMDLALFHLRRGDSGRAASVIRKYREYNNKNYYIEGVVEHFVKVKKPEGIIPFVEEVERGRLEYAEALNLHGELMKSGMPAVAAQVVKPFMMDDTLPFACMYTPLYFDAAVKGGVDRRIALKEAMDSVGREKRYYRFMAPLFHADKNYMEAFELWRAWGVEYPKEMDIATGLMAAEWAAGGGGPEGKGILEQRLAAASPWRKTQVGFYLGHPPDEKIMAQANDTSKAAETLYALAELAISQGKLEEAQKYMIMTLEIKQYSHPMVDYAYKYMKTLPEFPAPTGEEGAQGAGAKKEEAKDAEPQGEAG